MLKSQQKLSRCWVQWQTKRKYDSKFQNKTLVKCLYATEVHRKQDPTGEMLFRRTDDDLRHWSHSSIGPAN